MISFSEIRERWGERGSEEKPRLPTVGCDSFTAHEDHKSKQTSPPLPPPWPRWSCYNISQNVSAHVKPFGASASHGAVNQNVYRPFITWLLASFFTWSFPLPTSPAWNIPALQLRGAASRCPAPAPSLAVPWVCCALSMAGGSSDVTFSDGLPYHTSSTARQSLQVAARHITLFDRSFTEFIIT